MGRSLVLTLSSVCLILTAVPAFSQPQGRGPVWETLDLSPEQQQQLSQLRQERQAQILEILTEEQQQQLQDLQQQTGNPGLGRGLLRQLNLSEEQKTALRQLHEASQIEVETILTPEQQQQLQAQRQQWRRDRPGPPFSSTGAPLLAPDADPATP